MYDILPKIEKSFDFSHEGATTGHKYAGTFTVRCVLDIQQRHAMELEKTRLMADYKNPSTGLAGLAIALSEVRARVIEPPAWWKDSAAGSKVIDEDVIFALYNKCMDLEDEWKSELKKKGEEAARGNAPKES